MTTGLDVVIPTLNAAASLAGTLAALGNPSDLSLTITVCDGGSRDATQSIAREAGARVAHLFAVPQVVDYLDVGPRYGIQKLHPPEAWIGRSLGQLDLPGRLKLIPIALRRGKDVTVNPHEVEVIKQGDELILIGLDEKLEHLAEA